MRVVVTGASGCVGRAVVAALVDSHDVVCTDLQPAPGAGGRFIRLDIANDDPSAALDGAHALVHLAARAHTVPRDAAEEAEMTRINADATARLVSTAQRAGLQRLIYASTVAVYGDGRSDESEEPQPQNVYARTKLAGERAVREAGGVALRFSLVFGPGDRGNVALFARQIRRFGGVVVGDGSNKKSLVYAKHIGARVRLLLACDGVGLRGQIFNVVDWSPTQREFVTGIASALGKKPPRSVPLAPFLVAGEALDVAGRIARRAPRWKRRVEKLVESTEFSGAKLDHLLGYAPPISLRQALQETFG